MAANSAIEWTDDTMNAWIGCDRVADECKFCYAARLNAKYKWVEEWKPGAARHRTSEQNWKQPLKWNREAQDWPRRRRVFGGSLCDWLDEEVPIEWLADYLRLILATPNLDWLLLTKRIENFYERLTDVIEHLAEAKTDQALQAAVMRWVLQGKAPANVHLGLTVGSRRMLQHLDFFRRVPAKIRFLSMEPLLENIVDFHRPDVRTMNADDCYFNFDGIDGVIVGGESGERHEKIRPMHPFWAERIQMAVHLYNARTRDIRPPVTFFYKQTGDWMLYADTLRMELKPKPDDEHCWLTFDGETLPYDSPERPAEGAIHMVRLGKKRSGRLLRGREYNDLPGAGQAAESYYCPEHKYNPPPNSGLAFCPHCELESIGGEK